MPDQDRAGDLMADSFAEPLIRHTWDAVQIGTRHIQGDGYIGTEAVVLRCCPSCRALVDDSEADVQAHRRWHVTVLHGGPIA